jgi:hypothetical protein
MSEIEQPGVDVESLVAGGFNLLIGRRACGSWHVARAHRNPRTRNRTVSASGATLEDALRAVALLSQVEPITSPATPAPPANPT